MTVSKYFDVDCRLFSFKKYKASVHMDIVCYRYAFATQFFLQFKSICCIIYYAVEYRI